MVRLDEYEMQLLKEISGTRKEKKSLNTSYKSIVSEAIRVIHKREVKS